MKTIMPCAPSVFVLVVIAVLIVGCDRSQESHEHDTYTCPMHPTVISDRPGVCPVCNMDLVKKARPGDEVKITRDLAHLIESPNEVIVADAETVKGTYQAKEVSIPVNGQVTYDTRKVAVISSRIGGRLERVIPKYIFQEVKKGDKLVEIYSPELVTAQRELLYMIASDKGNDQMIEAAKKRLERLGLTRTQIARLEKDNDVMYSVSIFSPYSGYLLAADQSAPAFMGSSVTEPADGGMSMGNEKASPKAAAVRELSATQRSFFREGQYVSAGETLFKVVNTESLRLELSVSNLYSGVIRNGDRITIRLSHSKSREARIEFVEPAFAAGQQFLKVRVYGSGLNDLPVGQLLSGAIMVTTDETLWIPQESLIDLGTDQVVFLREEDVFRPRTIVTGLRADDMVQVINGLTSTQQIARNAQFLVDSESFIKVLP